MVSIVEGKDPVTSDLITAKYLEAFDLPMPPLPESESARAMFGGRYLSRPVFLGSEERCGLVRDLELVLSALESLPDRLFDGDLKVFAKEVGMSEFQIACVTRSRGPVPLALTGLARADLYRDNSGFRLLEWNLGSTVGGVECGDMCRTLLDVPEMAEFLAEEGLEYADTEGEHLRTIRSETGFPAGTEPVIALVETPGSFPYMETLMRRWAERWTGSGLRTLVGHIGELNRSDGRLRLGGEPVDVVYRLFMIEDVAEHADDGVLEPLLAAVELGEVAMFTPLDAELYGNKGALALLSNPEGRSGLTPEQQDACARLLPWTRQLRAGKVVLEDGRSVDLFDHALDHQKDLVLKPSSSHGGHGVVIGGDPDVSPAGWRDHLERALDSAHVLQRRIRPRPELFPSAGDGDPTLWTLAWGVFTMTRGFAGAIVRAIPADDGSRVVNFANGALVGCVFHASGDCPGTVPGPA